MEPNPFHGNRYAPPAAIPHTAVQKYSCVKNLCSDCQALLPGFAIHQVWGETPEPTFSPAHQEVPGQENSKPECDKEGFSVNDFVVFHCTDVLEYT